MRAHIDRVLRAAADAAGGRFRDAAFAVIWGGALYGLVMGSFGGLTEDRWLQLAFSALKVPMLIAVTSVLAMPSFFVLNSIAGLRNDFAEAVKAIAISQGTVGIVLACLAPFTAVWYLSSKDYFEATTFNGIMFAIASFAAQSVLRRRYAPLVARNTRHRTMLLFWIVLYIFVGIQMGWTLRPFVGDPTVAPTFFRKDTWGNAYLKVAEVVWQAVTK